MKYGLIWLASLLMLVSACDNTNSGIDENDVQNEAEIVATDTVEYVPERVDSLLVLPDTVLVTPDTVGIKSNIEEDRE
jgi:hypothetical protein